MSENKDSSNDQQKADAEDSKRKKKKKEDFYFGKLLGEGSYSTVGTYLLSIIFTNVWWPVGVAGFWNLGVLHMLQR